MVSSDVQRTPFSRVFLTEDGASPAHKPDYLGLARAGGVSFGQGNITPLRIPSRSQYDQFKIVDTILGAPDLPALTIEAYMAPVASDLMRIVNKRCAVDIQVHFGTCQNPEDFDGGWDVIKVLESARASNYSTSELGAIGPDQNAAVTETVPFSGERIYDVKHIRPSELAGSALTDIVNRVLICDSVTCGACGVASDGCQVMFAVTGPTTGSPGLPSELLYSKDGGATWSSAAITTLGIAEQAVDAACVGTYLAVVSASGGTGKISYAPIADILAGTATWASTTTGFVATKTPNRIISLGSSATWIAANGGYVYFTSDITAGVTVQQDGTLSAQNLNGVHAYDSRNIVVVGALNVVLQTVNGGDSWSLITGPAVGVALNCVWMHSVNEWLIGTAGGRLYYTLDAGLTWTEKAFDGSGFGSVRDIQFSSNVVGYLAHDTATPRGRVLRTVSGGNSWRVMPDERGQTVPATGSIRAIAACRDDVNVLLAGGTSTGGTDGYLAKYS